MVVDEIGLEGVGGVDEILEGVGELWHRCILGEQQTNAPPFLLLIAIFLFSSQLPYCNIQI